MFHFTICHARSRLYHENSVDRGDRLATSSRPAAGKKKRVAGVQINYSGRPAEASTTASAITTGNEAGSNLGHVSSDARVLARECSKEVGHELGVPR